jgi:hypothetical protein
VVKVSQLRLRHHQFHRDEVDRRLRSLSKRDVAFRLNAARVRELFIESRRGIGLSVKMNEREMIS